VRVCVCVCVSVFLSLCLCVSLFSVSLFPTHLHTLHTHSTCRRKAKLLVASLETLFEHYTATVTAAPPSPFLADTPSHADALAALLVSLKTLNENAFAFATADKAKAENPESIVEAMRHWLQRRAEKLAKARLDDAVNKVLVHMFAVSKEDVKFTLLWGNAKFNGGRGADACPHAQVKEALSVFAEVRDRDRDRQTERDRERRRERH